MTAPTMTMPSYVSPYLMLPLRELSEVRREFTEDEIRVILERHFGWEKASCGLLAKVFNTTPQRIRALIARYKEGGE